MRRHRSNVQQRCRLSQFSQRTQTTKIRRAEHRVADIHGGKKKSYLEGILFFET